MTETKNTLVNITIDLNEFLLSKDKSEALRKAMENVFYNTTQLKESMCKLLIEELLKSTKFMDFKEEFEKYLNEVFLKGRPISRIINDNEYRIRDVVIEATQSERESIKQKTLSILRSDDFISELTEHLKSQLTDTLQGYLVRKQDCSCDCE